MYRAVLTPLSSLKSGVEVALARILVDRKVERGIEGKSRKREDAADGGRRKEGGGRREAEGGRRKPPIKRTKIELKSANEVGQGPCGGGDVHQSPYPLVIYIQNFPKVSYAPRTESRAETFADTRVQTCEQTPLRRRLGRKFNLQIFSLVSEPPYWQIIRL